MTPMPPEMPEAKQRKYLKLMKEECIPEIISREQGTEADGWHPFSDDVDGVRVEAIKPPQDQPNAPGTVRGVTNVDFDLDDIQRQVLTVQDSKTLTLEMQQLDPSCLEQNVIQSCRPEGEKGLGPVLRLLHTVVQLPGPIWDRDFCGVQYMGIVMDEPRGERVWVCVVTSVEDDDVPPTKGRVRASFSSSGFVIRELKEPGAPLRVTYIVKAELGGALSPGLVHQMGSIQCRVAGRMRDNTLASKSAARLLGVGFPVPIRYPKANGRATWTVAAAAAGAGDGAGGGGEEVTADVECVGDMDLWLEVAIDGNSTAPLRTEGLGAGQGRRGRVVVPGWEAKRFAVAFPRGSRVRVTLHNPNWIQGARAWVKWAIRGAQPAPSAGVGPLTLAIDEVNAAALRGLVGAKRGRGGGSGGGGPHHAPPTPKERAELDRLRSGAARARARWGNFWDKVFVAQEDDELDEAQRLDLWRRVHRAIKDHQQEELAEEARRAAAAGAAGLGVEGEGQDPLRIAEQWSNFWNSVLLQQGHTLDEEQQRKNVWERGALALQKNNEILRESWQQLQEAQRAQREEQEAKTNLWDKIQEAVREHNELKQKEREERLEQEGPNVWTKFNTIIKEYQDEHKEGKPLDGQNLRRLWEQVNAALREEREAELMRRRARFLGRRLGSGQRLVGGRRRARSGGGGEGDQEEEFRLTEQGELESAGNQMSVWQTVLDAAARGSPSQSELSDDDQDDIGSYADFEVTSVVESMGAAESFIGQDGSNPRLPGEWPRLSNEGPQWQRNLETVWERVTRDFEREKERTEDALRTWNEREREKREQWRQETLKNVEKLKADTQKNVEKLKADTQKNVDKLKSDAIKNIDNLRENLQNLITLREARDSGSKKSAAIPFSQIWERSPAHQKDGKKQLNNENVDTEKDKDVLQRLGIDPKDLSLSGQEQVLQSRGTDPLNPLREEGAFMSRSSTLDSSELVWPNGTSSPQLSSPTKPAGPKGSNGDDGLDISEYKSSEVTSSMGDCEVTEYNSPQRSTLSSLVSVSESDDDNQGTEEERVAQWHRGQMEQKEHKAGMSKRGSLSEGNSPIPAKKEPHRAEIKKNTSQEVVVGEEDGWSPSLPIEKSATIPNQNNSSISSVLGTEPVQEWFPSPPMKNVTAPSYQKSANNTSISGASGPHPETHGGADECSITGTGGVSGEHSQWIVEEA